MAQYIWKQPTALVANGKVYKPEDEVELDAKHPQVIEWLKDKSIAPVSGKADKGE